VKTLACIIEKGKKMQLSKTPYEDEIAKDLESKILEILSNAKDKKNGK